MRDLNLLSSLGMSARAPAAGKGSHRFPFYMGVELELENVGGRLPEGVRGWTIHHDDSLRSGGLEFVFAAPYAAEQVDVAINNFYAMEGTYTGGARTSTHVHVNAGGLTIGAMRAIVGLSYILEDSLFGAIMESRKWCGYCMPLTEMASSRLRALLTSDDTSTFHLRGIRANQNADKYYGLNISSTLKHGTLEFRYFPGAPDKQELLSWLDYCTEIVKAGVVLEDFAVLQEIDSTDQLEAFLRHHLPTWGARLVAAKGSEVILERLNELQCLLEKEPVARRADPLIHVSPQLVGLACRILGSNKQHRDHIAASLQEMRVLSRVEWERSIVEARLPKPTRSHYKKSATYAEYANMIREQMAQPERIPQAGGHVRFDTTITELAANAVQRLAGVGEFYAPPSPPTSF